MITNVAPVQTQVTETVNYVTKVFVDEKTGVKTVLTSKPEDIKTSVVQSKGIQTLKTTEPSTAQVESIVRKEYKTIITETAVIKTPQNTYIQAVRVAFSRQGSSSIWNRLP